MTLIPVMLEIVGAATEGEMNSNFEATMKRGYTPFNEYLNSRSGRVHVCGAAPSLSETWRDIPDCDSVLAVNSAIGFLIDQGRSPTWAMIWDASPVCSKFARRSEDTTYLIGSRVHPSVFEALNGCSVVVWHAAGDHNILKVMMDHDLQEPLVCGGTAGVTRAMYLAAALGYREIHLHGADSCFRQGDGVQTHVRGSLVQERAMPAVIGVGHTQREFLTSPEMVQQVEEIKMIYPLFKQLGIKIHCHGDGFLQHAVWIMDNPKPQLLEEIAA